MTAFGHAMLDDFPLAPGGVYLNHGTVGVTPRVVMQRRAAILDEIERHPARFMLRDLMHLDASTGATPGTEPPRLRVAAAEVAAFVGCPADGLVFVDNATSGICAVLRSLALDVGDEVLLPDHAYGGVARAAAFIARARGATVSTFALPFPHATPDAMVAALEAALTPRTRVALLDHVTSETALVMPLEEMAAACRARGVAVLVDGAHAPGAIDLDIESLQVDWYAANLHKWAFAPRACGIVWAAPHRREGLHPAVISWGVTGDDWLAEFDWTGTRDPSPWLAAPAGIAFMIGTASASTRCATYNHALCWQGALRPRGRIGAPTFDTPEVDDRLHGRGAAARTRLGAARCTPPGSACATRCCSSTASRSRSSRRPAALWARLSIQVYNDASDVRPPRGARSTRSRRPRASRASRGRSASGTRPRGSPGGAGSAASERDERSSNSACGASV